MQTEKYEEKYEVCYSGLYGRGNFFGAHFHLLRLEDQKRSFDVLAEHSEEAAKKLFNYLEKNQLSFS